MAITFSCSCGAEVSVPDVLAGHRGRCPGCEAPLVAPGDSSLSDSARARGVEPAPDGALGDEPAPDTVRLITIAPRGPQAKLTKSRLALQFPCAGCQVKLLADPKHAGKPARCIHCKQVFVTPSLPGEESPQPAAPAPAEGSPSAPGAAALRGRDAFRVVRVACPCGRSVSVPLARLRAGEGRCPSCDRTLEE